MPPDDVHSLVVRAGIAQPEVVALGLDERLRRVVSARARLAAAGPAIVESAVRELAQPMRFARRELESALGLLDALPALAETIRPRRVPAVRGETVLEWAPYGVVLGWHAANSPVWVPTLVAASALVGGNAVLARPSSRARRTTGLVLEALGGPWPVDAIVMVDAPGPEAEPLVWAEGIHAVVTHASTPTCKRQLAGLGAAYGRGATLRPYIPEASGNDALLVLDGADLDGAAAAVAIGGFANAGQLCMAAKRIIVERAVWDGFRPRLIAAVSALRVGDPAEEATDIGPLAEGPARVAARAALAEARAAGGTIIVGEGERGILFTPTIVMLRPEWRGCALWSAETFAPLRGLMVVDGPDEAIALANDTPFGLGVAVFGGGPTVAERLRGARVLVDESPLYQDAHLVVGGVGESGMAGARPKLEQLVFARRVHRGGG